MDLQLIANERRTFDEWDEYEDPISNIIFYMNTNAYFYEQHALKLQKFFRFMRKIPRPVFWESTCFTFDVPESVTKEERLRAGWAILRRRAKPLG
jgi:hypothetical protein